MTGIFDIKLWEACKKILHKGRLSLVSDVMRL